MIANLKQNIKKLKDSIITKEDKISRIFQLDCDVFIDDLPEILAMPGFPDKTQKILFDADERNLHDSLEYIIASSWKSIENNLMKCL